MWYSMQCLINQTCGAPLALLHARETFYIVVSHTPWILSCHYYPATKWKDARKFKICNELAKLWYIGEDKTFINQTNQLTCMKKCLPPNHENYHDADHKANNHNQQIWFYHNQKLHWIALLYPSLGTWPESQFQWGECYLSVRTDCQACAACSIAPDPDMKFQKASKSSRQ